VERRLRAAEAPTSAGTAAGPDSRVDRVQFVHVIHFGAVNFRTPMGHVRVVSFLNFRAVNFRAVNFRAVNFRAVNFPQRRSRRFGPGLAPALRLLARSVQKGRGRLDRGAAP